LIHGLRTISQTAPVRQIAQAYVNQSAERSGEDVAELVAVGDCHSL
jgi:hypothetical protein